MTAFDIALWGILPYIALTVFVVGHIWRWRVDQFGWNTHTTQLLESRWLRIGSPLFHFGLLAVLLGHVIGLLIPKSWTAAVGISEGAYHALAGGVGTLAGIAMTVGLALLIARRIVNGRVRRTTTRMDAVMYIVLVTVILTGMAQTVGVNLLGEGHDYRETVSVWFRGIFALQPDTSLMTGIPLSYQLHALSAWLLIGIWPFTRLVHAWSIPIGYLWRPYVIYRSRQVGSRT
ncbi:respiratory nitrate reductase subunit gamma [Haloechinothrix sp. LS1_15]|uniref:respiratory nitrate reductase subunit gamma n=1 Tax=Haloechinothrix sp. LS1_15 TaxID=2652248 RepID=UPI00294B32D8|nr:respiratory nitrate reductase subunit gamma [Haloechinothrix sp. LS1_15]